MNITKRAGLPPPEVSPRDARWMVLKSHDPKALFNGTATHFYATEAAADLAAADHRRATKLRARVVRVTQQTSDGEPL